MLENPFTPLFGGKPHSFFGRSNLLTRFDRALQVPGSDDRVLFITGTRGSGKTALLEQFSQHASRTGWRTIDVGAERALPALFHQLAPFDDTTETLSPALEVKILGSSGSLSGRSSAKTRRSDIDDLAQLLVDECRQQKRGVFVSIDEIQKVSLEDMVRICEAFQMASRKGCNVALAVAGLPHSYDTIIHEDGCTFMRRSVHEPLNLLTVDEVRQAFSETFGRIKQIQLDDEPLNSLVSLSSGHPYMMQLLGYHLVELLNQSRSQKAISITQDDIDLVAPVARAAYNMRSLRPLLDELSESEQQYLVAMAKTADETLVSRTNKVADYLGKTTSQLSSVRKRLIDNGIIVPVAHGAVRFNVPFLRSYVLKPTVEQINLEQLEAWGV